MVLQNFPRTSLLNFPLNCPVIQVEFDYRYLDEMDDDDESTDPGDNKSYISQDTTVLSDPNFKPGQMSHHPLQVMVSFYTK